MVSGLGYPLIVTPVMKINGPTQKGSGGVRQHDADLVQHQLLLAGHDQKLESAVQAFAIAHRGSHLHDMRRDRDGKLQGNNFAGLQLTAEGRADAVLAELAASAPASGRPAFAKHRHLNAHVETITGETPEPLLSFGGRWCVDAQSSFSIADPPLKSCLLDCASVQACPQRHQSACTKGSECSDEGSGRRVATLRIFFSRDAASRVSMASQTPVS